MQDNYLAMIERPASVGRAALADLKLHAAAADSGAAKAVEAPLVRPKT